MTTVEMRTKRRYAHELYPHPEESEVRPLEVEVPYLYARAFGWDVEGTNWHALMTAKEFREANDRTYLMLAARGRALHADALLQGLSGQDAWNWAETRNSPEGDWIWDRAVHYGVDPDAIKPYPCGGEPDHHDHLEPIPGSDWRNVIRIDRPESECPDCCEPVDSPVAARAGEDL